MSLLVQAQRFPRARHHRGLVRAHLAAAGLSIGRKLAITGATIVTIAVALAVAVAFNPYLTAKPAGRCSKTRRRTLLPKNVWQRFLYQVKLRLEISSNQKTNFPNDALVDLPEKARVILVQGFGRFGPFGPREADSTMRYDFRQDWGAFLWLPLVCFGLFESVRLGLAQLRAGKPPAALASGGLGRLRWVVVTLYLPMAWDRYQLPDSKRQRPAGRGGRVGALGSPGRGGSFPASLARA